MTPLPSPDAAAAFAPSPFGGFAPPPPPSRFGAISTAPVVGALEFLAAFFQAKNVVEGRNDVITDVMAARATGSERYSVCVCVCVCVCLCVCVCVCDVIQDFQKIAMNYSSTYLKFSNLILLKKWFVG